MPYLHIQISGPADRALSARVAQAATALTAELLGKDPAVTAVAIDYVPADQWFVGGAPLGLGPRSYHWMVSITDETNTKEQKAAYLEAVHRRMGELLGGVVEHSYIHVADLRAAGYGWGGKTQEHRYQHGG